MRMTVTDYSICHVVILGQVKPKMMWTNEAFNSQVSEKNPNNYNFHNVHARYPGHEYLTGVQVNILFMS